MNSIWSDFFFNSIHQIDDAGNLNEEEIKKSFKDFPLLDYQKPIVDTAITTCVAKAKESQGGHGGPLVKFHFCMWREFMKACPADKQDTSEHCVRMREGKGGPKSGEEQ